MNARHAFLMAIPINSRVRGQDVGVLREGRWRMGPVCSHMLHGVFSLVCNTCFLTASAMSSLGGTRQHLRFFSGMVV